MLANMKMHKLTMFTISLDIKSKEESLGDVQQQEQQDEQEKEEDKKEEEKEEEVDDENYEEQQTTCLP